MRMAIHSPESGEIGQGASAKTVGAIRRARSDAVQATEKALGELRRRLAMPIRRALKCVRNLEHARLIKIIADKLHPDRTGCSLSAIILMRRACSRLRTHFSARRIGIAKRRRNSPRAFSVACTASLRARRIAHTVFALAPCAISLKNALDVWPYLTGLWRMYCHAHL